MDYTTGQVEYVDQVYSREEYANRFEEQVKKGEGKLSEIVAKFKANPDYEPSSEEAEEWEKELQQPNLFISEGNLQKAYKNDLGTIWDFIKQALGIKKAPTIKDRVADLYQDYIINQDLTDEQRQVLYKLTQVFIGNGNKIPMSYFQNPLLKNILGYNKAELDDLFNGKLNQHVSTINETFA